MAFNINAHIILSGPKNLDKIAASIQSKLKQAGNISINLPSSDLSQFTKSINQLNAAATKLNTNSNQIANSLNKLNTLNTSTAASTNQLANAQNNVAKASAKAAGGLDAFGRQAAASLKSAFAFAVTTRAVFGLSNAIKSSVKDALEFERSLINIAQTTGESLDQLKVLKNTVSELSIELGLNANELVEVARTLAQTGQTAKQVEQSLTALAKSSLSASFGDIKETTEGLVAALAQFNIATSQSEQILGALNSVSKAFAVEAEDLITAIRKAGGVFSVAATDAKEPIEALEQLAAIFTAVRSTTRESAETIGTGLRTIFTRIQRAGTIEFLKKFNIELVNSEGQFVGLFEAFRRLSAGLDDIIKRGDALQLSAIVEELGGVRQVGKLIPAIREFQKAEQAFKVAQQGAAEGLTKDVDVALGGLAKRFEQTQAKFQELIRGIAESATFQNLARLALTTADAFISLADKLKPLLPLIATLGASFIAKGAAQFAGGFFSAIGGGGLGRIGTTLGGGTSQPAPTTPSRNITNIPDPSPLITNTNTILNTISLQLNDLNTTLSTNSTRNIAQMAYLNDITYKGFNNVISAISNIRMRASSAPVSPPKKIVGFAAGDIGKASGGKIYKFARGGVVPGQGNQDTVPAMLTPGEFVIKKSSVNKIGTDTLAAMNENRKMSGSSGSGERKRYQTPDTPKEKFSKILKDTKYTTDNQRWEAIKKEFSLSDEEIKSIQTSTFPRNTFEDIRKKRGGTFTTEKDIAILKDNIVGGLFLEEGKGVDVRLDKSLPKITEGLLKNKKQLKTSLYLGMIDSAVKDIMVQELQTQFASAITNSVKKTLKSDADPTLSNTVLDRIDFNTIQGYMLEGFISSRAGALLSEKGANIDFVGMTSAQKQSLNTVFTPDIPEQTKLIDAKRTADYGSVSSGAGSLFNKILSASMSGQLSKDDFLQLAKGGLIGNTLKGQVSKSRFINKDKKTIGFKKDKFYISDAYSEKVQVPKSLAIQYGISAEKKTIKGSRGKGFEEYLNALGKYGSWQTRANYPVDFIKGSNLYDAKDMLESRFNEKNAIKKALNHYVYKAFGDKGYNFSGPVPPIIELPSNAKLLNTPVTSGQDTFTSNAKIGFLYPEIVEDNKFKGGKKKINSILKNTVYKESLNTADIFLDSWSQTASGRASGSNGVGETDTVPALLTPGEFVINREAAKNIGYGNLNRMNKQGVVGFNKGGIVGIQRFENGGMAADALFTNLAKVDLSKIVDLSKLENVAYGVLDNLESRLKELQKGVVGESKKDRESRASRNAAEIAQLEEQRLNTIKLINTVEEKRSKTTQRVKPSAPAQQAVDKTTLAQSQSRILKGVFNPKDTESFQAALQKAGVSAENSAAVIKQFNDLINMGASEMDSFIAVLKDVGLKPIQKASATGISESGGFKGTTLFEPPAQPAAKVAVEKSSEQTVAKTTSQSQDKSAKITFNPKDSEGFKAALQKAGVSAEKSASLVETFNFRIEQGIPQLEALKEVLSSVKLQATKKEQPASAGMSESGGFRGASIFEPPSGPPSGPPEPPEPPEENTQATDQTSEEIKKLGEETNNVTTQLSEEAKLLAKQSISRSLETLTGAVASTITAFATFDSSNPLASLAALGTSAIQAKNALLQVKEARDLIKASQPTPEGEEAAGPDGLSQILDSFTGIVGDFETSFAESLDPAKLKDAFDPSKLKAAVTSKEGFVKSLNLGKGGIGAIAGKAAAGGAAAAAVSAAIGPAVDGLTNALFGATESIEGFAGREGWTQGQAQILGGITEGLKGAASGAAAGAVLGPVGAAIGALIGGAGGAIIGVIEAGLQQEAYNALKGLKSATEDAAKSLEEFNKKTNIGADDINAITSELATLNKDAGKALQATYKASLGAVGSAIVGSEMGGFGPGVGATSEAAFGRSFIDSSDFTDVMTDIGLSLINPTVGLATLGNTLKDMGAAAGEMLGVGEEVGSLFVQFATLGLVNIGDLFTSLTDQVLGFAGLDSATVAATATAESFAAVMKSIGPEAIQQANDALAKSAQQFVKDLDTLNATEFVDQLAGLDLGKGIFDNTTGAFKQLGDTLTQAANAGNKAAQALKSQMEQTFQLNVLDSVSKQIEMLNASGDKQGVLDLSKAFQFLQSSGRPASEWTEVLAENLNQLGLASSFGADPLFKIIKAEQAKQVELLKSAAIQAQTNRLLKESRAYIDALGEGLKKFGDVASQAANRFDMFAANLSQSIEQAFSSTAGGFQVQRFNPFENIDIASDLDISRAFEEFRTYASPETGNIAFGGLEDLTKVTKEIPFMMKDIALGMVVGGENQNVDPQAFLQTITDKLSGAGIELPDVAYEAIRKQLEAMAKASDDGTVAITDFIDSLEEGDIGSLLGGLGPQMLEEASKVRAAGDKMTNTLLRISDMQLDLARKDRMHRLEMFKMAEDTEARIAKIRGTGMVDETTRAEKSISGQMMAVAGTTDTAALLTQRQTSINERNRLQTQINTGRIGTGTFDATGQEITRAAEPEEQKAATEQLKAMNEQFESSTQALEIFARETERLAAIEAQAAAAKERESRVVGGSIELFKKLQNEARTGRRDTSIDEDVRSTAALGKVIEGGTLGQDEALGLLEELNSGNNAILEAAFSQAKIKDPTLDRAKIQEKLFKDVAKQVATLPGAMERFGSTDAGFIEKVLVAEFEAAKSESQKLADEATRIFEEQKNVLQQIYEQNRQQAVEALAQADQAFLATVLEFEAAVQQFADLRSEEVQVAEGKRKIDQQAAEEKKADEQALAAEKEAIASGQGVQTAETRKMALDTMVSEREKTVQAKAARLQAFETEKARRNTYIDKGDAAFNSDELREYESLKREVSTGQSELQDFKRAQEEAGLMVQQENLKKEIDSGQLSEADKSKKQEELAGIEQKLATGRAAGTYGRYEAGREDMINQADKRVAQENKDNEIAKVEARYQQRESAREEERARRYAEVEQTAARDREDRQAQREKNKEERSRMAQEASGVTGPTTASATGPAPAAGAAAMGEEERKVREAQAKQDQRIQMAEDQLNGSEPNLKRIREEDARAALPPGERAKEEQKREEDRRKAEEMRKQFEEERRAKREKEIAEARARDQAAAGAIAPPAPGAREATAAGAYNQSNAAARNAIALGRIVATPPTTPGTAQMQQLVAGQTVPISPPMAATGAATGQIQRPTSPYEARLQANIARGQENLQNLGGFSNEDKQQLARLEAKKKEGNIEESEKRQLTDLRRRSTISSGIEERQTALKSFQSEQSDFGKNLKSSFKEGGEMMVQSLQTFIDGFQSVTSMIPEMIQTNVGGEVTINLLGTKGMEDSIIDRMKEYLMSEIVPMLKPKTNTREGDIQ